MPTFIVNKLSNNKNSLSKLPFRPLSSQSQSKYCRITSIFFSNILEFAKFNWEDPLNLNGQLSEDERGIMEMTRKYCKESLMPRVLEAYRHESKKGDRVE